MDLTFEWDEEKARENWRKHGVRFEEAKTIFDDPFLLTFPDAMHSDIEARFLNIGVTITGHVLVVVHTERPGRVRLISSRKATIKERKVYEETGLRAK